MSLSEEQKKVLEEQMALMKQREAQPKKLDSQRYAELVDGYTKQFQNGTLNPAEVLARMNSNNNPAEVLRNLSNTTAKTTTSTTSSTTQGAATPQSQQTINNQSKTNVPSHPQNGFHKITYPNGRKYEGELKNGMYHGKGKFIYPDGETYEGTFKNTFFLMAAK